MVMRKFCFALGEKVMAPCRGDSPTDRLEVEPGGEFQMGDAVICCGRPGEVDGRLDDLGGELNKEHLELKVPLERRVKGALGSLSVGEELRRLREESLRGRRLSSRSLSVRM